MTSTSWFRRSSSNDWLVLGYLTLLCARLVPAPAGVARTRCVWALFGLTAFYAVAVFGCVRARWIPVAPLRALLYRLSHFAALQCPYLLFATYLPLVSPGAYDAALHAFDLSWFGLEPAFQLESWIGPFSTEWFAFFYYSYFLLIAALVLPVLFLGRHSRRTAELLFGVTCVFAFGQSGYLFVPGFGPHRAFADQFRVAFPDGLWWNTVRHMVETAGAQKDIFPSLHVALPSFLAFFAYHHRQRAPYGFAWPFIALAAFNIAFATLFLRWHYLVDVLVGWALACTAYVATCYWPAREQARRDALECGAIWPTWKDG